jgi:hypothetical protein
MLEIPPAKVERKINSGRGCGTADLPHDLLVIVVAGRGNESRAWQRFVELGHKGVRPVSQEQGADTSAAARHEKDAERGIASGV